MPVRIDRIDSTVDVDPDAGRQGGPAEQPSPWEAIERARRMRERDERDRVRTCARDHDD